MKCFLMFLLFVAVFYFIPWCALVAIALYGTLSVVAMCLLVWVLLILEKRRS